MSIYDGRDPTDFLALLEKNKNLFLGVIGAIVLIAIVFIAVSSYKPSAFSFAFSKNPVSLERDSDAILTLSVVNVTGEDARNVSIEVFPKDSSALHVFPTKKELSFLGVNEIRNVDFRIQMNKEEIVAGNYSIQVGVKINNEKFDKTIFLNVVE